MIKANQLRIGNLINYANNPVYVRQIFMYDKVELGYFTDSIGFERELKDIYISPIRLTEEWLIKFGFKKIETCVYVLDEWIKLSLEDEDWDDVSFDVFTRGTYMTCIQNVHQLQNYYFAICFEELTVTL